MPSTGGEQADRAVHVLGVLADDGDAVRVAVLDQHAAVAIEHHAARRAQRQRPLVVVLGHLLELRVLDDLQHPEADRQHRKQHGDQVLEHAQPEAACGDLQRECDAISPFTAEGALLRPSPLDRSGQKFDQLKRHHADHRIAGGLPGDGGVGVPNCRKSKEH